MNKQLEQKLSSREVAQMMDMEHKNLLKKIESINKDFESSKVSFQKYWVENTYKVNGNNKSYKEFQITKRGCEFLAHKTFGAKGNIFTDKYMDRFEDMKNQLSITVPVVETIESYKIQDPMQRYVAWIKEQYELSQERSARIEAEKKLQELKNDLKFNLLMQLLLEHRIGE